jgi:hypothetical protein
MDKLHIQLAITALYWVVSQVWVKKFCVNVFNPAKHSTLGQYKFEKFATRFFAPVMVPWFLASHILYGPRQKSHRNNIAFLKAQETLNDSQKRALSYSEVRECRSRRQFHKAVLHDCENGPEGIFVWLIGAIPIAALAIVTWGKINWTELASPVFQVVGEFLTKVAQ